MRLPKQQKSIVTYVYASSESLYVCLNRSTQKSQGTSQRQWEYFKEREIEHKGYGGK